MALWVKVATSFQHDEKVAGVSLEAELVYLRALMWAKEHESDGFIPDSILRGVVTLKCVTGHAQLGAELCDARLWERVTPDGYRVPLSTWRRWQVTADQMNRKRELAAERKRRSRERHTVTGVDKGVTGHAPVTRDASVPTSNGRGVTGALEPELELEQKNTPLPPLTPLERARRAAAGGEAPPDPPRWDQTITNLSDRFRFPEEPA